MTNRESRPYRSLLNVICCVFDSEEDDGEVIRKQNSFRQTFGPDKKEKNDLVLVGNLQDGNYSLVRIT